MLWPAARLSASPKVTFTCRRSNYTPSIYSPASTSGVGHALPGYSIRLLTTAGTLAGPAEDGELVVAGDAVADVYLGEVETDQRERLKNRTFRTGDLARRTFDGAFEI